MRHKINCRWIAFDLDGTLYTSEPVLYDVYRSSIIEYNRLNGSSIRIPSSDEIFLWIGYPVKTIFRNVFPELTGEERVSLSLFILGRLVRAIREGAGEVLPGVKETLDILNKKSPLLYVVTNGRREYLSAVVEGFDIKKYFRLVLSIEDGDNEDKGDLLLSLIKQEGLDRKDGVMIGDRLSDSDAAVKAGIPFIGCDFGHGAREELAKSVAVIKAFPELLEIIESTQ